MNKIIITISILAILLLVGCNAQKTEEINDLQKETQDVINANDNYEEEVEDVMEALDKIVPDETKMENSFEGYGLSYEVDGITYAHDKAQVMAQTPVADYLTIISPDATKIQIRTLPNEKGKYTIGEGPDYREVNVWFVHEGVRYDADQNKGSGIIKLDSIGTMDNTGYIGDISGTFEGTFVASDGKEITVKNGKFLAEGLIW